MLGIVKKLLLQSAGVLLLTLALLEGALQLAGFAAPRLLTRAVEPAGDGIRILCVGDSHTFGSGAALMETYPRLLQEDLARRHPGLRFEVQNLGVPGMNSTQVANRLERQIDELRPELVIVWVGINNPWNAMETAERSGLRRLLMHSRLFRLAAVAWATRPPLELTRERRPRAKRGEREPFARREANLPWAEALRSLDLDFSRAAALARARRVPLIFLNYPYAFEAELRAGIRDTGARLGVPVVDTLEDARRAEADGVHPVFIWGAGFHPSGSLNRYISESVSGIAEQVLDLPPQPRARDTASP